MIRIHFFKEDVRFRLVQQQELKKWIHAAIRKHAFELEEINYIFCSDQYLLRLNREFLNHDFFTDIITFDHGAGKKKISADIFISVDRVQFNSGEYGVAFREELNRVMIHGVLHLLGYKDKTKRDQQVMRKAEDDWLGKRSL
ncbi:MAG: rRNA maturation RNase YbeY [Bacteroidetes bacterium]|nr:rRNA maturation RNase YbeY [Bacteroidota bacterium]